MILLVDRVILDQGDLGDLAILVQVDRVVQVVLGIHLEDRKVLILLHLHH